MISNGRNNLLIDSGPARNWSKLERKLNDIHVSQLEYLVLTHTHFDHAGNASAIRDKYNTQVIVHQAEVQYITKGMNTMLQGTNPFTQSLVVVFGKRILSKFKYKPCHCDIVVHSFFDLKAYGFNAYIIHTPGHSPGSISVIVDNEIALVGDTMFGVFKRSVNPPYAENPKQTVQSWGTLLATNCYLFLPAHGAGISRELVQNNFDKLNGVPRFQ
jgi:hydroxyacylglutathione hydrolase